MKIKTLSRGNICQIFDTISTKGGSMPFFRKLNRDLSGKGGPLD